MFSFVFADIHGARNCGLLCDEGPNSSDGKDSAKGLVPWHSGDDEPDPG